MDNQNSHRPDDHFREKLDQIDPDLFAPAIRTTVEAFPVRLPGDLTGQPVYGGMVRVTEWEGGKMLRCKLSPLETDNGLLLTTNRSQLEGILEKRRILVQSRLP